MSGRVEMPGVQRPSPYQGLIPYDEEDAQYFFGREKETRIIVANLFAAPLTLLYGTSGVGKSSVLRAGVIPQLRKYDDLIVIFFTLWQGDSILLLKDAVRATCPDVPLSPSISLAEYLTTCSAYYNRRIFIMLDQFEEYFLYHRQRGQDDVFVAEFSQAITQTNIPSSFLISIREDSLAKLDLFDGYIPVLFDNFLRLDHLDRRGATDAIVEPVMKFNELMAEPGVHFDVEPALIERLIDQVKIGKIVIGQMGRGQVTPKLMPAEPDDRNVRVETPFLQLVLARLWEEEVRKNSQLLRLSTLNSLKGAEEIIHSHLDAAMNRLKTSQQEVASYIFNYLVTPSGTKIALSAQDMEHFTDISLSQTQSVMNRLSDRDIRILRPISTEQPEQKETLYELFHDALAPAIVDWRAKYLSRKTIFQRMTGPIIMFAIISLIIQALPPLADQFILLFILRGLAYVILHIVTLLQVYQWFYQQVRPKIITLPVVGGGGHNLGLLLSLLLPIFWYTSTKWPEGVSFGTMPVASFILYLFTLVLTMVTGLIVFFLFMQSAGQLTYKFFNKQYALGFYGTYIVICTLIGILIVLTLVGVISGWIVP